VIIKNGEGGPLKNCTIALNDEYKLSPVTIENEGLYPTNMFSNGSQKRFDAQTTVVTALSLECDSPRGRVGGSRSITPVCRRWRDASDFPDCDEYSTPARIFNSWC
jgi:hypothetical protein